MRLMRATVFAAIVAIAIVIMPAGMALSFPAATEAIISSLPRTIPLVIGKPAGHGLEP